MDKNKVVDMNWFLTEPEKENVAQWKENTVDNSLSTKLLSHFWDWIVRWVPRHVPPNILTLAGLLCSIHAYYVCLMYMDRFPRFSSFFAGVLIFVSHTLDGIDGRHARIIRNASPIGDFFAHVCNNIASTFLTLTLCELLGLRDYDLQWYLVQTAQLIFLRKHFRAFKQGYISFSLLGSPGEIFLVLIIFSFVRAVIGVSWLVNPLAALATSTLPASIDFKVFVITSYYLLQAYTLIQILTQLPAAHTYTRNGLAFCILYLNFPSIMNFLWYLSTSFGGDTPIPGPIVPYPSYSDIFASIGHGIFASVLTSDMILAKMAKRPLHSWVVVFAMLSLFHYLAALFLSAVYYIAVFSELCHYMNLPMFSVNINVYCSGVFDLCHLGHMRLFEHALKFGTRLYVGVCSDEDCTVYKRRPIMTMQERLDAVSACKFVTKVIPRAPCFDLPVEFLLEHDIHVVALSEEYDRPDDKFYAGARELGIAKVLPRTPGLSTSDLMKRIISSEKEREKKVQEEKEKKN